MLDKSRKQKTSAGSAELSFVVAEVHRSKRWGCFIGDIRIICRAFN